MGCRLDLPESHREARKRGFSPVVAGDCLRPGTPAAVHQGCAKHSTNGLAPRMGLGAQLGAGKVGTNEVIGLAGGGRSRPTKHAARGYLEGG